MQTWEKRRQDGIEQGMILEDIAKFMNMLEIRHLLLSNYSGGKLFTSPL